MYILYIHACTFPWKSAVLIKILRQSDKSYESTRVNKNLGCSFMQHNLTKGLHPHTYRPSAAQGYTGHAANVWRSVSGGRSPQQQREKVLRSNAKRISLMFSCMFVFGPSFFLYYPLLFLLYDFPWNMLRESLVSKPLSIPTSVFRLSWVSSITNLITWF